MNTEVERTRKGPGGARPGAGRKPLGKIKLIRVSHECADKLARLAVREKKTTRAIVERWINDVVE